MMVNRRRGDVAGVIDGTERRLCLTLGSLAELEAAYSADNLVELASRFEAGTMSARDLSIIIAAGLRGAGEAVCVEEVSAMQFEGGLAGAASIAVALLSAAFGGAHEGRSPGERAPNPHQPRWDEAQPSRLFHGMTSLPSGSAS